MLETYKVNALSDNTYEIQTSSGKAVTEHPDDENFCKFPTRHSRNQEN